ncbi:hypothetical protein [Chryseobacterium sp. JM1]|uniref:hypothetical protein n=1 Tax=Chryseobacterium sp. JM1 TaxID=1233950 RepID=UPI0004E7AA2E|nr:hypothetical protein [Chryseobacterium sp. JM1]KFF17018.1 hypothetical protein IW22_21775 [Chryseobacterium sp. JM1]
MSIIGVECNADRYFFGRLLNNKGLIRKERNDTEVIKSVAVKSKGNFSVGIIDIDKNKKIPKNFNLIYENNHTKIFKHTENCQFLIAIGPRQFEHWINEFLKNKNINVEDFDFESFDKFMQTSKSLKPEMDIRFKNIIDVVIQNYDTDDNHILTLKKHLEYIIETKYHFSITEFNKI